MRTLIDIKPLRGFKIECTFEDGTKKTADIAPYLEKEAFKPLSDWNVFSAINNRGYFVEWKNHEIDLSADTLWHIAV